MFAARAGARLVIGSFQSNRESHRFLIATVAGVDNSDIIAKARLIVKENGEIT